MRRLNFTLNEETIELLNDLAQRYYKGNKSRTIRAALESLAAHTGHEGWIITGYTALRADGETECHICGGSFSTSRFFNGVAARTPSRRFPARSGLNASIVWRGQTLLKRPILTQAKQYFSLN